MIMRHRQLSIAYGRDDRQWLDNSESRSCGLLCRSCMAYACQLRIQTCTVPNRLENVFVRPVEGDWDVVSAVYYSVPYANYQQNALLAGRTRIIISNWIMSIITKTYFSKWDKKASSFHQRCNSNI